MPILQQWQEDIIRVKVSSKEEHQELVELIDVYFPNIKNSVKEHGVYTYLNYPYYYFTSTYFSANRKLQEKRCVEAKKILEQVDHEIEGLSNNMLVYWYVLDEICSVACITGNLATLNLDGNTVPGVPLYQLMIIDF